MIPIGELRAAIPTAILGYGMSWQSAFLWSFIGNIIPAILLLFFLDPVSVFLMKNFKSFKRFFTWLFGRTRAKHSKNFEIWGAIALVAFIAIPLPGTGAWAGAAAAFVFGIKPKKAVPLVALGILGAGIIVTMLTVGIKILI